ncbi:lipopolysaccharide biosynthesis protein [Chitinophaga filiformis]|uniref:oligosaccharide flippase family protein n=1 Tax=Chitinophaga filiformis TaxID=104663 RepID=UPI001F3C51E8|nr:lipopolysaccharide biosynthesis protein [Chitinophaga filiformis]MCF6405416.1 lipopolysaccharide biosynthesis protein [Chitinophaga filiformis]
MGVVRTKSLVSSIYTYFGFILGAINIYLMTKYFAPAENGLTRTLFEISTLMTSVACLGIPTLVARYYPYYRALPQKKMDLLTLAFALGGIGILIVFAGSYFLEPLIIRKFSGKSPLLVEYFYISYPLVFFFLGFQIMEVHAWNQHKTILSNFMKEVVFRVFHTIIVLAFIFGLIRFHTFMNIFGFTYAVTFCGLIFYFWYKKQLPLGRLPSQVTKDLGKQMLRFTAFIFASNVITIISLTIDSILISSFKGLEFAAVFTLATYICTVIDVPQRSMISIGVPIIAQSWKDNDMANIANVYTKSSINLLIFSSFIFSVIWLNLDDAFDFLKLPAIYHEGKPLVLILGITKIIELGTGLNSQVISTSPRWRFELQSHLILLALTLPLNYYFVKTYGIMGAGVAQLISLTIYNGIRYLFLLKNYNMQPFTRQTLYSIILTLSLYFIVSRLINISIPLLNMIVRTLVFAGIYGFLVIRLNLSEDITILYKKGISLISSKMGRP